MIDWTQHTKLVRHIIHKKTGHYEDLYQEGCLALYQASLTYQPGPIAFSTYAYPLVKFTIIKYQQSTTPVHIPYNIHLGVALSRKARPDMEARLARLAKGGGQTLESLKAKVELAAAIETTPYHNDTFYVSNWTDYSSIRKKLLRHDDILYYSILCSLVGFSNNQIGKRLGITGAAISERRLNTPLFVGDICHVNHELLVLELFRGWLEIMFRRPQTRLPLLDLPHHLYLALVDYTLGASLSAIEYHHHLSPGELLHLFLPLLDYVPTKRKKRHKSENSSIAA